MSEHNNDPIIDRVRDGEGEGLRHVSEILPEVLDEEGITIHSTDDDIPQIGRVTIELTDTSMVERLESLFSDVRDTSEIRDMIVKFGRCRQLQGQHEGPEDGWVREPYDLRCEADDLLEDIMTLVG